VVHVSIFSVSALESTAPAAGAAQSHDVAFMHEGSFVEAGEAHALLETPQVQQTKAYVLSCTQLEQQSRGKNLRNVLLTGKSIFDL